MIVQQVAEQIPEPGFYVIGVLDILDQSRRLAEHTNCPSDSPAHQRRLERNLRETVGTVHRFRQRFHQQFNTRDEIFEEEERKVPEDERDAYRAALAPTLVRWGLSDTYFVAVPFQPGSGHMGAMAAFASVHRLLQTITITWLTFLAERVPSRGGIELGLAAQMHERDVYGQALLAAHHLESVVAQWPRVVVGERLVAALEDTQQDPDPTFEGAAMFATRCRSMLMESADANMEVDLLGGGMWSNDRHRRAFGLVFARAHAYVRDQLSEHQATRNTKLIGRYEKLLRYFDSRAPAWHG